MTGRSGGRWPSAEDNGMTRGADVEAFVREHPGCPLRDAARHVHHGDDVPVRRTVADVRREIAAGRIHVRTTEERGLTVLWPGEGAA